MNRDPNTTPPTLSGPGGRAWNVSDAPWAPPTMLRAWILHSPGSHPLWSWYLVALADLADREGVDPAVKLYPEAEYEIAVFALDPGPPEVPIVPDLAGDELPRFLTPQNVREHFDGLPDYHARTVLDRLVFGCCRNILSPDSDYRSSWRSGLKILVDKMKRIPVEDRPN